MKMHNLSKRYTFIYDLRMYTQILSCDTEFSGIIFSSSIIKRGPTYAYA